MSGPFGERLGWGQRPALLLVDVVNAYLVPGSPLDLGAAGAPAVRACAQLLAAARAAALPVVHTRVGYTAGLVDAGHFGRKVPALAVFAAGAPGGLGDAPAGLAARTDEPVLVKQYASAFFGTSLAATLTSMRVDTVVLAGFSTSGCVRASATDAVQHGFAPLVVREACGDRTVAVHEANLQDLDAKYADVVSLADALTHISGEDPRG